MRRMICVLSALALSLMLPMPEASAASTFSCGGVVKETQIYSADSHNGSAVFLFTSGHFMLADFDDDSSYTEDPSLDVTTSYSYVGSKLYIYVDWWDEYQQPTLHRGQHEGALRFRAR